MRRLLLMRHAKSAWPPGVEDSERGLEPRGRAAAAAVGAWLRARGEIPDAALVSTARRTRETWDLAARSLFPEQEPPQARFLDRLYLASPEEILAALREEAPPESRTLLALGHNDGLQSFAEALCGGRAERPADARAFEKFPTGAVALYEIRGDWADLTPGEARLAAYLQPRDLA
ncbi:histidine phosphatase family protein [Neomegalonema sp.]|uniref:SixA phosphatase family protein n=1 Tax=Neomegalonema sp. TaxID=2039713 RepID=UPI0026274038|nr:histidine phosphatase family protein [Neomegalonema sp.]MDD2867680.1 histidine phosphatase family protein [Neomegalonema sp.]